eukprot:1643002-Rhodomonas_salina.2
MQRVQLYQEAGLICIGGLVDPGTDVPAQPNLWPHAGTWPIAPPAFTPHRFRSSPKLQGVTSVPIDFCDRCEARRPTFRVAKLGTQKPRSGF